MTPKQFLTKHPKVQARVDAIVRQYRDCTMEEMEAAVALMLQNLGMDKQRANSFAVDFIIA